ncbi:DNA repair protein RAD51-like protein 2 [Sciurus carolinensis]|uniref:DNA repair protein RAD51-like protein 2 n=1 Tax=Sciurus carolinensis TaxID=30640 RepID=A0AA41NH02_SCICA|nr:DNA repair protein RAD51-like protein 2 [Sciurus carolinensis]
MEWKRYWYYSLCDWVILTNQITTHLSGALASQADLVSPADDLSLSEGLSGSSCVIAALGNTWSHSVNTRLILQYLDSERRQILIAKSPLAPFTSFVYTIKEEGLVLQVHQSSQHNAIYTVLQEHSEYFPNKEITRSNAGVWIICSEQQLQKALALELRKQERLATAILAFHHC